MSGQLTVAARIALLHYDRGFQHIKDEIETMSAEESREVIEILSMFAALQVACARLSDHSGIDEERLRFRGFSAASEGKQLAYARFYASHEGGQFISLIERDSGENREPMLDRYRRMLPEWERSPEPRSLTQDDLIRITSA